MNQRQTLFMATGLALAITAPVAAKPAVQTAIQPAVQKADWRIRTIEGGLADGTGPAAESSLRLIKKDDRPPGWNKGNKKGWGGRNVPPGQAKKRDQDRDRYNRDDRTTRDRDRNGNGIPDYRERDRDRDGIPDYRDSNTNTYRSDRNRRGSGYVDRNRNGVDDRYENRRDRYDDDYDNRSGSARILFGTITGGTGDRSITVRLDNGGTRNFNLQRDASVVHGGRSMSPYDLRSGDRVQMRVVGSRVTSMVVY